MLHKNIPGKNKLINYIIDTNFVQKIKICDIYSFAADLVIKNGCTNKLLL